MWTLGETHCFYQFPWTEILEAPPVVVKLLADAFQVQVINKLVPTSIFAVIIQ